MESGYQYNTFKSPEILERSDSLGQDLSPLENSVFVQTLGEFDVRKRWGEFVGKRSIQKHQLDIFTTFRDRRYLQLEEASNTLASIKVGYRHAFTPSYSWVSQASYSSFLSPEAVKTPTRNMVSFAYRKVEGSSGIEINTRNHQLHRLQLRYTQKDYTFINSLDRTEYAFHWYGRKRFRDAFRRLSYLRMNHTVMYRSYKSAQGGGIDEEGFLIPTGKRKLLQIRTEWSYQKELGRKASIQPGLQLTYRNDITPDRFDYYQIKPSLTFEFESDRLTFTLNPSFTQRNYLAFASPSFEDEKLRYRYASLRFSGVFAPKRSRNILPFWDIQLHTRQTNNERESQLSFRGYRSWRASAGVRIPFHSQ